MTQTCAFPRMRACTQADGWGRQACLTEATLEAGFREKPEGFKAAWLLRGQLRFPDQVIDLVIKILFPE